MAAIYNDGTVQYGSKVLTIGGTTYVAENLEVSRPSTKIERRDELGEPSGKAGIKDFVTGTATLQIATSATQPPQLGDTFTETLNTDDGSETFWISSVGDSYSHNGARKVSVSFDKKYVP